MYTLFSEQDISFRSTDPCTNIILFSDFERPLSTVVHCGPLPYKATHYESINLAEVY